MCLRDFVFLQLIALLPCSCTSHSNSIPRREAQENIPPPSSDSHKPRDPMDVGLLNGPQTSEAWRQFTEHGHYRWAQADDFRIPNWAMNRYRADIIKSIETPFRSGDIDHDGAYGDFALIVVDTERQVSERFGIVIFNEAKQTQGKYDVHWLFRNKDLSRTVLNSSSEGLGVEQFLEDGTHLSCFVQWNPLRREYYCNLIHVP